MRRLQPSVVTDGEHLSYIPERAYFYGGKLITSQLSRGQKYQTLKPVSTSFLLNSIGFPEAKPWRCGFW